MDADQAKKLRAPFKASQIGKLPKPTKRDNTKGKCAECGGWHGLPAVHLDYVGHAAVTDRFLEVDPEWTWEPMAKGEHGEPLVLNGGMWINLTIAGVTRPGFGDATGSGGMKEMIGDALRNAGMRFGVGLDLWAKEDLHADDSGAAPAPAEGTPKPRRTATTEEAPTVPAEPSANGTYATEAQRKRLFAIAKEHKVDGPALRLILQQETGQESTAQIPRDKYDAVCAAVESGGPSMDGDQFEDVPFA